MSVSTPKRIGVVGAGWSGLAAAIEAQRTGHKVTLFEMAQHPGGRARSVKVGANLTLDNGQHILIGAYHQTLDLMRCVGIDPQQVLLRLPLEIRYPDGTGLKMSRGPASIAFALAALGADGWSWADRIALLRTALGWWRSGMRNPGVRTVAELCQALPDRVRVDLIDPLCVAALNTPSSVASADVFLRVLADALFGRPGSSDLLLPRVPLSGLLPSAALTWLRAQGAQLSLGHRVQRVLPQAGSWMVDDAQFDGVVLACSATETARLTQAINPTWSGQAAALTYEPIATVYLRRAGPRLPCPMVALRTSPTAPAQFAFDLEVLGMADATVALVVSSARQWVAQGMDRLASAVQAQAIASLPLQFAQGTAPVVHCAVERRATFACTPALQRPQPDVAPGLAAAGDYVTGPYPATLEGAVLAGMRAAQLVCRHTWTTGRTEQRGTVAPAASAMQK